MANLTENPQWEAGIYQLEETDPVEGGPNGIDNRQGRQLANRTTYLKSTLEAHQSAADPHPQYATDVSVAEQLAALVASAPGTLATLNSLAESLNNDPDFATSMTAALAAKLATADKASTAQAQAGTDDQKWMTPLKTAQAIAALASIAAASETISGTVELATVSETLSGTDAGRAVHPAGLKAAINAAVSFLVNSSPGALDTLNELAAALGNDANFAATMTNALAAKVAITSKSNTAQAQAGTDDQTWMTPLKTAQAIAAIAVPFAAGTRMPFAQAAAPTGWTQDTSANADNRMLRVVKTAGGGVGGTHSPILNDVVPSHTHGFTTGNVSSDHSHAIGDPGHVHGVPNQYSGQAPGGSSWTGERVGKDGSTHLSATGIWTGGISANHSHSGGTDNGSSQTNWQPRYIDMIICVKN